jgi:hypothetical protein
MALMRRLDSQQDKVSAIIEELHNRESHDALAVASDERDTVTTA